MQTGVWEWGVCGCERETEREREKERDRDREGAVGMRGQCQFITLVLSFLRSGKLLEIKMCVCVCVCVCACASVCITVLNR